MSVLSAFMYVHHICACCPWSAEEGVGSTDTGISDGWARGIPGMLGTQLRYCGSDLTVESSLLAL